MLVISQLLMLTLMDLQAAQTHHPIINQDVEKLHVVVDVHRSEVSRFFHIIINELLKKLDGKCKQHVVIRHSS